MQNHREFRYTREQQIRYIKRLKLAIAELNISRMPMVTHMILTDAIIPERLTLEELNVVVAILKRTLSNEHVRINNELLKEGRRQIRYRRPNRNRTPVIERRSKTPNITMERTENRTPAIERRYRKPAIVITRNNRMRN